MQVADNGTGISFEDFKLLGERYATSKAHCLSDLEHLRHYGYRGEALASTTEVSGTVEVSSRPPGLAADVHKDVPTTESP